LTYLFDFYILSFTLGKFSEDTPPDLHQLPKRFKHLKIRTGLLELALA
jgi:hypothetical protein